jgi:opacity protein-like surface antigen
VERYFAIGAGAWLPGKTSSLDTNFSPVDVSYKTGWGLGAAVGVAADNGLRLENELVYREAVAKGASDSQWSLGWLINVWWDAKNSSPFTPYFGGGFGYGRGTIASPGPFDNSGSGIAYQAGGGIDYRLSSGLSLDLGYRYFGIGSLSGNDNSSFDLAGSSLMAGVRMRF